MNNTKHNKSNNNLSIVNVLASRNGKSLSRAVGDLRFGRINCDKTSVLAMACIHCGMSVYDMNESLAEGGEVGLIVDLLDHITTAMINSGHRSMCFDVKRNKDDQPDVALYSVVGLCFDIINVFKLSRCHHVLKRLCRVVDEFKRDRDSYNELCALLEMPVLTDQILKEVKTCVLGALISRRKSNE